MSNVKKNRVSDSTVTDDSLSVAPERRGVVQMVGPSGALFGPELELSFGKTGKKELQIILADLWKQGERVKNSQNEDDDGFDIDDFTTREFSFVVNDQCEITEGSNIFDVLQSEEVDKLSSEQALRVTFRPLSVFKV